MQLSSIKVYILYIVFFFVMLILTRLQGNLVVLDKNWIENIAYLSIIRRP